MRIYDYTGMDGYDWLRETDEMSLDVLDSYDGRKKKDGWIPFEVEHMEPEKGLPLGDSPVFHSGIPAFSEKAVDSLYDLIRNDVEVLPTKSDCGRFFVINITSVLDCLDHEKSEYKRFTSSNRIMRVIKYAFYEEAIKGHHIFKIKEFPYSYVFVTEEFREVVERSGLTGFRFKEIWSSEADLQKG